MNEARMKMELHKVLREIQIHGTEYMFFRKSVDDYGEDKEETKQIAEIKGLFHVTKGYVTRSVQDGTETHSKGQPILMIAYEDVGSIQMGDFIVVNGNTYKVVEKNNIQEYNIVIDISLELIIDGRN